MKRPIVISALILAVGGVLGWGDHQQLLTVREVHEERLAGAGNLGISIDPTRSATDSILITKHAERDAKEKEADARHAAAEFIAFAKEMEALEKKGEQP